MKFNEFLPQFFDFIKVTNDTLRAMLVKLQGQLDLNEVLVNSLSTLGDNVSFLTVLTYANLGLSGVLLLTVIYLLGKVSK